MTGTRNHISRRAVLLAGGGTAIAATGGVLTWVSGRENRVPTPATVGLFAVDDAVALLPPSPLRTVSGPQSFAFDAAGDRVYALQVMADGLRLPDEEEPVSGHDRKMAGDMCVSVLSLSGRAAGHMYLRGFGHGVSMGVESSGEDVLLWVESDVDEGTGYGRAVARVPFRDGAVLDSSSSAVRHHRPLPGSRQLHPAFDPVDGRVLVSHWIGEAHHYAVYRTDDFLDGRYEPLHTVADGALRDGEWVQGCALHGNHIYQLTGKGYTDEAGANPPSGGGDTYVSALDVRTGEVAGRRKVTVAPELEYREPEGIAVRAAPEPQLCVGFSVKTPEHRRLAVYACPAPGVTA
ncbi:signaling protein [Streptomyces sp. Tu10]|uniref:phage baseplate protein n=1 Tax=Streptomyces TaxID=1883 RepID=UPI001BDD3CDC|nr:signaling protein [Streptomyces sp. Tu10]MBT1102859.1 signaling protein [Streptomyces sp. Tu10]